MAQRTSPSRRTNYIIAVGALISVLLLFFSFSPHRHAALARAQGFIGGLRTKPSPSTSSNPALVAPHEPHVAIVAATIKKNNDSWIGEHFPDWAHHIYSVDGDPAYPLQASNKGREGAAYLSYILDNYHNGTYNTLADYVVFTHDSRYDWHNDDPMYDAVSQMKRLKLSRVDEEGYINLRCVWKPGCHDKTPISPRASWDPKRPTSMQLMVLYGQAMLELFPSTSNPDDLGTIHNPCCAQFAVSKKRILESPRERYEAVQEFVNDWSYLKYVPEATQTVFGAIDVTDPRIENMLIGNIMENMWHMLFGRPQNNCLPVGECYCKNFCLCDLKCPEVGKCEGHYWPPPQGAGMEGMPDAWPDEGQGEGGWPVEGWNEDVS